MPADRIGVDLSDVRGASYYTGVSFTLLAPGPGEPVGAGGRYDGLLARFDHPAPATGFALDVENLASALAHAGARVQGPAVVRAVIVMDGEAAHLLAEAVRTGGVAVAALPTGTDALAYARAWGYDAVLRAGDAAHAERSDGGGSAALPPGGEARALTALVGGRP